MEILIAEDDPEVASLLAQALVEDGYQVEVVGDGHQAYALARSHPYSVLLLDVMLPGIDGVALCRELRADHISTPILMITARDTLKDKIEGLDSGADDYVVKPFLIDELMARMRAVLRRGAIPVLALKIADITLNPRTRKVQRAGETISLSATECMLLEFLMRNQSRVVSRAEIFQYVWEDAFDGNDKILDVYINHLRTKIDRGRDGSLIQTVRGVGYRMEGRSVA